MDRQNFVDGQELILLINGHSEHIRKRTSPCVTTVCCHCGLDVASSHTSFAFHGTRARRFLVLVGPYVCKVAALLSRWRCPQCRKTFTDYPPFACPHKAYTLPQITERTAKYVSNAATSYRKGMCAANLPIFYAQGPADKAAQHCHSETTLSFTIVAHTSLFHWVTALGTNARRRPEPLGADFTPASRKYVSEQRRSILIACRATCVALFSAQGPPASSCE